MGTQSDDDATKPHTFSATFPGKGDGEPVVPLTKDDDSLSWSERDRREALQAEEATRSYPPTPAYSTSSPYSSTGPSGSGGPGGYGASVPQPQGPAPQATPVSRAAPAARRARLKVSHLGPLSVLRISLTFSLCMFIVLLVAVAALWGVLDSSGVFKSIVDAATTLTNDNKETGVAPWLSFGRVMLITVVLGAANVIAFTLLSTIGALLYNLCSDFVGGVEVTLVER
jgi:hypothetical protein